MIKGFLLLVAILVANRCPDCLLANPRIQTGEPQNAARTDPAPSFGVPGRAFREDGEKQGIRIDIIYSRPGQKMASNGLANLEMHSVGEELHRQTTFTDAGGGYRIEVPEAIDNESGNQVTVEISSPGFLTRRIGPYNVELLDPDRDAGQETNRTAEIARGISQTRLRAGVPFNGRVLLTDGSPAVDAVVWSSSRPEPYAWKFPNPDRYPSQTTTKTDNEGRFELLVDRVANMSITVEGQAPLLIGRLEDFAANSDFQLPSAIRPHGKTVDQHGDPVAFAIVNVWPVRQYDEDSSPPLFYRTTVSDEDGTFSFPPLPPGTWQFKTTHRIADRMEAKGIDLDKADSWHQLETASLQQVFLDTQREFTLEQTSPTILLRASVTHQILVEVKLPEIIERPTSLRVSGNVGNVTWLGPLETVTEPGMVSLVVPHGLERAQLHTGIAFLQTSEEAEKKIGHRFQFDRIEKDLSGYVVTVPEFARLNVKARHPEFDVVSSTRIEVVYADDRIPDRHLITADLAKHMTRLAGRTSASSGLREFSCMPIADQKVVVVIRNEAGRVLHQESVTLDPDEEKEITFNLGQPGN